MARKPRASRAKDPRRKLWTEANAKAPLAVASLATLRQIRDEQQCMALVWPHEGTFTSNNRQFVFTDDRQDYSPMLVDTFTTGAILAVYNNINADNKAKFDRMIKTSRGQFLKIATFCLERVR